MRLVIILICFTITFGCRTKEPNEVIFKEPHVNKKKEILFKEDVHIDSILTKLSSINLPYSSKNITGKVKYYDSIGGFFVDTTFSKMGIQKLFTYADIKNPIQVFNSDTLSFDFLNRKSNTTIEDDLKFTYQNNDDYNYNIDSQILFPIFKKELEKFNLIGSYSQYFGENDIAGVFFILTSFDKTGKQIDYLIVFNRFTWENGLEIDFDIKKDFSIQLERKEIEYFDGDLENELDPPRETNRLENYILNNVGVFEMVKK